MTQPVVPAAPAVPDLADKQRQLSNLSQHRTMDSLLKATLLAATLGAGYRGLVGLNSMYARDRLMDLAKSPLRPTVVRMPGRRVLDSEEELDDTKYAAEASGRDLLNQSITGNAAGKLVDALGLTRPAGAKPPGWLKGYLMGYNEPNAWNKLWAVGTAPFLIGGGLAAGYKGTDMLLDKSRKSEVSAELEAARREYEEALYGKQRKKVATTESVESSPKDMLDDVYDSMEKQGFLGALGGAYLAALLGVGGLTGATTYAYGRSRNKSDLLEKALRRRAELYAERAPAPIVVMPEEEEPAKKPIKPKAALVA